MSVDQYQNVSTTWRAEFTPNRWSRVVPEVAAQCRLRGVRVALTDGKPLRDGPTPPRLRVSFAGNPDPAERHTAA